MKIQRFLTGPLEVNCYLMIDEATGKAAVLDPGGMNPQLEAAINQIGEKNVEKMFLRRIERIMWNEFITIHMI